MTKIEWCERTWNPIAGCSLESPGCTNCYAMKMAHRLAKMGHEKYQGLTKVANGKPVWTGELRADEKALYLPLQVNKPTMWFVNSMSDLFHPDLPFGITRRVFDAMGRCPHHTFQVLTKRPEVMLKFIKDTTVLHQLCDGGGCNYCGDFDGRVPLSSYPFQNVWLGTSVEDRKRMDRIDVLRKVPAAVRFLSLEPLLEDLGELDLTGIHWVIVGGESGPGARPFNVSWLWSIVSQCREQGIPLFIKQMGASVFLGPDVIKLHNRKGGDPSEWPADLRIREFPVRGRE